jgi:peptidoglycan/LPS O-acetylase OafA/YrhL
MKIKFSLLDALRFFAAFWVMNFHYFLGVNESWKLSWYRFGGLGVQLFFIISGFVIVLSLKGKTLKEFAINRFIRLFPLFWILCTFTFILTHMAHDPNALYFSEYLKNMTMFGDIFNGYLKYGRLIDPSYWTLTVELIFYAGIGIFVHFFSYKNIRYFLAVWMGLSVLAFILHIDHNFYVKLALVRHASYFVFGSALALIVAKEAKSLFEKYFDWSLLLFSSLYSIYIHTRAIPEYFTLNPYDNIIVSILLIIFFIGIPALVYLSPRIKNIRTILILEILGGITYPLYLMHQTIGNLVINRIKSAYNLPWNVTAIAFEIFVISTAYFVYLKDKKLREWLRSKLLPKRRDEAIQHTTNFKKDNLN